MIRPFGIVIICYRINLRIGRFTLLFTYTFRLVKVNYHGRVLGLKWLINDRIFGSTTLMTEGIPNDLVVIWDWSQLINYFVVSNKYKTQFEATSVYSVSFFKVISFMINLLRCSFFTLNFLVFIIICLLWVKSLFSAF